MNVFLNELGMVCALGCGLESVRANLFAGISPGMRPTERYSPGRELMLGMVDTPVPDLSHLPLPLRSRNNGLLALALQQIRPQIEARLAGTDRARIAVIIGTSTSGIAECESAVKLQMQTGQFPDHYHYGQQELASPAAYLARELGIAGPAYAISTACSSSAKALASGARLLRSGMADMVLAGGVDSLCQFTVAGFSALESVSATRCNPVSKNRCGINIGEGAALFVMTRETGPVRLTGWGESSDGYHISAPDPQGIGAQSAIRQALARAGLAASDIGYINLHGTATPQNDAMESCAVTAMLPGVPASSTKPLTGHTLGAAGAIEAGIGWLTLTDSAGRLPPQLWDGIADEPALPLVAPQQATAPKAILSNSFAFGGNNIALVLSKT